MGNRANFVVVRDGHAKGYYDNWAAMGCLDAFAAGPEGACEAIAGFEPVDELMDWAFAEGGYLIDFDEKTAMVFGSAFDADEFHEPDGQSRESNLPFQQGGLAYLEHIGPRWVGWKLVWDDHGVDAFAAHRRGDPSRTLRSSRSHTPRKHPTRSSTMLDAWATRPRRGFERRCSTGKLPATCGIRTGWRRSNA